MADGHIKEGASAGEDEGFSLVEPARGSVAQMDSADAINSNALGLNSFSNEPKDTRIAEDAGREDMFVDCPDEIENSESQQNTEEMDKEPDDQSNESDSGIKVKELMAEIEFLRDMCENCVAEKERFVQEHEEERAMIMRELAHLHHQLKVANEQQTAPGENVNGLVDHLHTEGETWDVKTVDSGASLLEMISECSWLIKGALEDRLQTEEKVRELHSVLYMKDQENGFLSAKVSELSESIHISQSSSTSNDVQLEKDQQIEEIVNRILASLFMTHRQDDLLDGSLTEKISNIERSVTILVEKYNYFISESDQLREILNELGLEFSMIDEIGTFAMARDKIVELGRREQDMYYNLSNLDHENKKLVEQLEKQKSVVENLTAEIGRLSAEVEQERNRYANTKEKLSMAVTKGKSLVQHRDSLKQQLSEKTSQLEKCSIELQEKSTALEAAEKTKELLEATEKLATSLQESLTERDTILQKCGEILDEGVEMDPETEDPQSTDITEKLRWLADQNKSLKAISLLYHKLTDALLLFDFPETVASSELDVRVRWLAESFYLSKEEATRLQSDIAETKEAANEEINRLTTSLLAEIQEKIYLQAELEDLRNKYEACERLQQELVEAREALNNEIYHMTKAVSAESQEKSYFQLELENLRHKFEGVVQKEYLASLEKHKIVRMLLEASGLSTDGHGEVHPEHSDTTTIIDNCLAKIKENTRCIEPSPVDVETLESFKSLLYITDQEMRLYKLIVEEDILDRAQVNCLSDQLELKTLELNALKDEKAVMKKSFDQLEDRCALLKEKLSMAVKKGKGLVQERETMKGVLNEKNSEIDRLNSELQQSLSKCTECQDQITKLSLDLEHIPLIEREIVAGKERTDQLEQFLAESNSMLQRVMESVEGISTPTDLTFEDPAEKVKWIAGYLSEHETSKMEMDRELRKVKDEETSLASKLSEVQTTIKSLEDALSISENSRSQILDEKKELEVSKVLLEDELQKEKEKASSHTSKIEELSVSKRALEDALSLAEDNISRFTNERDIAEESRTLAEEQLQKLKEEFSDHIRKLADADKTIQSLEHALSESQKNVSILSEENSKVQISRADLDSEIKKFREEADSYASKLSDASLTIKSLEDALLNTENKLADLVEEKKNAEEEILGLTSKLESCMEELAETRGSVENGSMELFGQLSRLESILKDETLSSLLGKFFMRKFESLSNMDSLLTEMSEYFQDMDSDILQNSPIIEDDSSISTTLPSSPDIDLSLEMLNNEVNAVDSESIMSRVKKINDRFHLKSKILADKFDSLSTHMDESIAAVLGRLRITKDRIIRIMKDMKYFKQQVKGMETEKQRQESLEGDIKILLSACTDGIRGLELNVQKNVSQLRSIHELVTLDGRTANLGAVEDDADSELVTDHVKAAEKLLLATRHNQDLSKLFWDAINKLMSIMEDMQEKMKETQLTCDEVLGERDLYKDRISKLETDLKAQQNFCHEMTIKLDGYKEKEEKLRRREEELSTSLSKVHEFAGSALSASQVKSILDKMNEVEVPNADFALRDSHDSANIRKLFYVLDTFSESLQKVHRLSCENEELQSMIDTQILEIETLKKQVEDHVDNKKISEETNKLLELESGLRNIVQKLGGSDLMNDLKVDGEIQLLPLLDKLVMATVLNSENLKSKNEELGAELLGTQKVVDDLSNKIKLLEDTSQARIVPPEIEQETGISIASQTTQSEISEMQDANLQAALGKSSNIPPVPSAAHVRTLRKGSNDHLAINIDSDSERLIGNKESDEDKGHVFKSLNTSGLIPRQGRTVADRIDGIWVSGSRALMSHPRGRLGFIAYWIVLHIWLLGTIL